MKVLTVRQPWAWFIMHAGKDIENRSRPTKMRGRIAIHASTHWRALEWKKAQLTVRSRSIEGPMELLSGGPLPQPDEMPHGAIVGTVEIVDCVTTHASQWFYGPYGYVLRDPRPLSVPIPCKGMLGFWQFAGLAE